MTYRIEDLPAILDSRENEVTRVLSEKTLKQRNTIRDLRGALKELVQDLASKAEGGSVSPETGNDRKKYPPPL